MPVEALRRVDGPVFVNGVDPTDIGQGRANDCFLMGALAAIAVVSRRVGRNLLGPLIGGRRGDGTYPVTLFKKDTTWTGKTFFEKETYNVAPQFDSYGADTTPNNQTEIWVALFEKAYAMQRGGGSLAEAFGKGRPLDEALEALTGQPAAHYTLSASFPLHELQRRLEYAVRHNNPVTFKRSNHTYAFVRLYKADDGYVHVVLYNPLGTLDGMRDPYSTMRLSDLRSSTDAVVVGGRLR